MKAQTAGDDEDEEDDDCDNIDNYYAEEDMDVKRDSEPIKPDRLPSYIFTESKYIYLFKTDTICQIIITAFYIGNV